MRYTQRAAIVTGAASGIGRAIAEGYLDEGARVVLVDFREDAIRETIAALPIANRGRAVGLMCDVRDGAQIEAVLDSAFDACDHLDILVNAAGIYPSHVLLDMSEADWDNVLNTNLKGPLMLSKGFAKRLVQANRPGNIVNITSGAALRARPGAAHYTTSKAALNMLTKSMALELAPHDIRVNAVSPGLVDVHSVVNPLSDAYMAAVAVGIPLGRPGRPVDIARMVLFVTSEEAAWTTGSIFSVDGGTGAGNSRTPLSGPNSRYA